MVRSWQLGIALVAGLVGLAVWHAQRQPAPAPVPIVDPFKQAPVIVDPFKAPVLDRGLGEANAQRQQQAEQSQAMREAVREELRRERLLRGE